MDYGRGTLLNPELHILLDEPTKLTMTSEDVIHSLFVPAFRAKKDIVPGRYNYMWFQPTVASEKVSDEEPEKGAAIWKGMDSGLSASGSYDQVNTVHAGWLHFL